MLLLLALAIPDDSDEHRLPLPPPKFHSHRHHHHLGPSFRLLELERKFDAAKTAVVDGRWATVGTTNIDRLSLTGNYEVNLEIVDDGQAAHMQEIFRKDLTNCRRLTLEEWQQRGWWVRGIERLLRPLQPLL